MVTRDSDLRRERMGFNVAARLIGPPPPTKTFGLNCLVSVTLRTGVGVWVALIKLEGNCGVPGFGGWLRV